VHFVVVGMIVDRGAVFSGKIQNRMTARREDKLREDVESLQLVQVLLRTYIHIL
jgi:hypothetical protein